MHASPVPSTLEGNDAALIGGLPTYVALQDAVTHATDGEVIGV